VAVGRAEAICGAAFLEGDQWGALDGALVITALKGSKLLVLTLADDGSVEQVAVPQETDGPFGRLRAVGSGPTGLST
jgi:glucose/arabinose dehydrogenase